MKVFSLALSVVMIAAPTMATAQATDQARTEATADNSPNRVICKRQNDTGSRLGSKRVCMTAAQWTQLERDQREATEKVQTSRWKSQ